MVKVNDVVAVIQPPIGGPVVDVDYDKTTGELKALVQVGTDQQRWFPVTELSVVSSEGA